MALSQHDSLEYILNLPVEFLEIVGDMKLPAPAWEGILGVRPDTTLVPYSPVLIRDLTFKTEKELLRYRGLGKDSVNKIKKALQKIGLDFGMVNSLSTLQQRYEVAKKHGLMPHPKIRGFVFLPSFKASVIPHPIPQVATREGPEINTLEEAGEADVSKIQILGQK